MFSYIKRHWPVYVILTLIAIALGFGAAYIVGAKRWSKNRARAPMGFLSPSKQSLMVDLRLQSRYGDLND